jgi:hypothetical protein
MNTTNIDWKIINKTVYGSDIDSITYELVITPTINLANKDWKKELTKVLNNRGTEENIQKPNFNFTEQKVPANESGSDGDIELIKETLDVSSIFELLNIKIKKGTRLPGAKDVLEVQKKVIESLKDGINIKELTNIANEIDWVGSLKLDEDSHKKDRKDRAIAKIEQRVKDSGLKSNEEYIAYQIVEELNEVAEVLLRDNEYIKNLLDIQKAIQKIVRFGPDTKIKDGKKTDENGNPVYLKNTDGSIQTNKSRAEELIKDSGITFDSNKSNTNDYLMMINKKISDTLESGSDGDSLITWEKDNLNLLKNTVDNIFNKFNVVEKSKNIVGKNESLNWGNRLTTTFTSLQKDSIIDKVYSYSGVNHGFENYLNENSNLYKASREAERLLNKPSGYFNHILINKFQAGNKGMGAHKDNESLYIDSTGKVGDVAVLSIGDMESNHVINGKKIDANNGTLIMFNGNDTHSLGKAKEGRISITFRHIPENHIVKKEEKNAKDKGKYFDIAKENIKNNQSISNKIYSSSSELSKLGSEKEYFDESGVKLNYSNIIGEILVEAYDIMEHENQVQNCK